MHGQLSIGQNGSLFARRRILLYMVHSAGTCVNVCKYACLYAALCRGVATLISCDHCFPWHWLECAE